jgi:hypothetical protein
MLSHMLLSFSLCGTVCDDGRLNLGSGLFGFFIGAWTVVYFLISVPLLEAFTIDIVFYIYAGMMAPFLIYATMVSMREFKLCLLIPSGIDLCPFWDRIHVHIPPCFCFRFDERPFACVVI